MDEKSGGCLGKIIGSNCNNTITSFTEPWSHPSIVHHTTDCTQTQPGARSLSHSFNLFREKRDTDKILCPWSGRGHSYVLTFKCLLTRLVLASHRNLVPLGRRFTTTLVNILTLVCCNPLMHSALGRIP